MTTAGQPFIPAEDNEPPRTTVLMEILPSGRVRIWFRRNSTWHRDGDLRTYHWARLTRAARAGSTFTVLYRPNTGPLAW